MFQIPGRGRGKQSSYPWRRSGHVERTGTQKPDLNGVATYQWILQRLHHTTDFYSFKLSLHEKNQCYSTTTENITFFLLLSSFLIKQLWNKIIVWHNSWVTQKLFCNAAVAKSTCRVAAQSKPTKRFSIYKQQKSLCFGNNNFVFSVF